jgi:hypothetical protein
MNAKETDDISCILQGSQLFENGRRNLGTCETNILEMRLALSDPEAPFRNPHRMNASFDATCAQSIFNSQPAPLELL